MSRERVTRTELADQISQLPESVIDIILSRLPLTDAARTSVLSKEWRDHWTRIANLVFDRSFINEVIHCDSFDAQDAYQFASIAGFILVSHVGPIRNLVFDFPDISGTIIPCAVNVWVRSAARCGVKDLTLKYGRHHNCYQCPSVFQCKELELLSLESVQLQLPTCNFRNLPFLRTLELVRVDISGDMLTHIFLSCPLLESFRFDSFMLDDSFIIEAPSLKLLSVTYYQFTTVVLKNVSNISTLLLRDNSEEYEESENTVQDIVNFFDAVRNVKDIDVYGIIFEQWHKRDIPERLPAPLKNHRRFIIHGLDMYCPRQIQSMLCIIKSSPKLETFQFSVIDPQDEDSNDTMHYLRAQQCKVQELWSLKSVRITDLRGEQREMIFIQLILSCSPMLETLYFGCACNVNKDVEFKMMTSITRFRRASTQAELIYLERGSEL